MSSQEYNTSINNTRQLKQIRDQLLEFTESPLFEYREKNGYYPVIGEGSHEADIMFIGEAPGKSEAEAGRPFCGRSGKVLDELLEHIELKRDDVYITNVLKDRPPGNRDPKPEEIELYTPFLIRQIDIIQPTVVATLGRFAMEFIKEHFDIEDERTISQIHGETLTFDTPEGTSVQFVPLFHPAVALYDPNKRTTLEQDFENLQTIIKKI